jgi:hypothetical protein
MNSAQLIRHFVERRGRGLICVHLEGLMKTTINLSPHDEI